MQAIKIFREGQGFHQKGKRQEALQRYERALKIDPALSEARIFKAVIYLEIGQPLEALKEAEQAVKSMKKPDIVILVNYGIILKNLGRLDDAALAYEHALQINPNLASAKSNLATIYFLQGKLDEAAREFEELTRSMEDAAPWLNLARIALIKNELDKAAEYVERAEDFDLTHPDCLFIRGRIALSDKNFDEAYQFCIKCLKRSPAHRDGWLLLQSIDSEAYDLSEISIRLEELAKLKVQSSAVLSIAVDISRKHWLWESLPKLEAMLSKVMLNNLDKPPSTADIFTLLGADISQKSHLNAASKCWEVITSKIPKGHFKNGNVTESKKKVRVGIISSDLRGHAIGYLVVGLFEKLPKKNIEWWAYTNSQADSSNVRERLKDNFDRFININKLDDIELAEKIKSDEIDVLIDLNQMTAGTRVAVFAQRPAPVQIQWLGMPGTLGAGEDADYVIVDPWVVDEKNADGFSECLLMLPRSYQPNDHIPPNLNLCPTREQAGLPDDGFIFGVFNQYYKFSPDTVDLWADILKKVEGSYLWLLKPKSDEHQQRILGQIEARGIAPERIIFAEHKSQDEHLARLRHMDLVLDTWPYNAHTTCSDALRVGVPVLTFPHDTFASRVASGILHTAELSEWVANSPQEYVFKAVDFAKKARAEITSYKEFIHNKYWQSPMVDNDNLGRIFEAIILHLHEASTKHLQPTSIKLTHDFKFERLGYGRQQLDDEAPFVANSLGSTVPKNDQADVAQGDEPTLEVEPQEDLPSWVNEIVGTGASGQLKNIMVLRDRIIGLSEIPIFLDVGAALLGLEKRFNKLANERLIRIVGFEPDDVSYAKLTSSDTKSYLPYALGDGETKKLNLCAAQGMNSLLQPDIKWLSLFPRFAEWGSVKKSLEIKTKKLDEISEANNARFLKLDTQGSELLILKNGTTILKDLCFIELECSPTPLYEKEASFFEIGDWLSKQGYVLHTFTNIDKRCFKPYGTDDDPLTSKAQIFQIDSVFMPHPYQWVSFDDERLKSLAYIAHIMYRSFDVTFRALSILDERDNGQRADQYKTYLELAGLSA